MISVFGGFVFVEDPTVKSIGFARTRWFPRRRRMTAHSDGHTSTTGVATHVARTYGPAPQRCDRRRGGVLPQRAAARVEAMTFAQPSVMVFDVNETLSDMSPMSTCFTDIGAPAHLAQLWFAAVLRDGFALTAAGRSEPFARIAAGLLERAGIADRFERLLSVEQAGWWKPARSAYAYAAGECGVQPAEAMLVAVHPWDVDGAHRAGMSTAWLDRSSRPYPSVFSSPDLRAGSLPDLAEQLGYS